MNIEAAKNVAKIFIGILLINVGLQGLAMYSPELLVWLFLTVALVLLVKFAYDLEVSKIECRKSEQRLKDSLAKYKDNTHIG
ncbi:MAG: hypothetical protein EBT95_05295 [Verrucomicrobia bacterium]|nr:hypothetical protein [Verrucomicrobiota bacterium]